MKKCSTCKENKDLVEFNKNKAKKDGYNTICRSCSNIRSKKYYGENREKHLVVIKKRKAGVVEKTRKYICDILKSQSCKDCGTIDIRVLEFDHTGDNKIKDVMQMVHSGYKLETIKKEISKCEIVCCNCHRIRTFNRANSCKCR
jgi:hypothetical protein